MNTTNGTLYGIGLGPGDPDLLTLKAVKVLQTADLICVPNSKGQTSTALEIVRPHLSSKASILAMGFSMSPDLDTRRAARRENAELIQEHLRKGQNVAFLTLGDPMLYSTYSYILDYLPPEFQVETVPGIYSFSAISSLLSQPLVKGEDKLAVISSFDEAAKTIIRSTEAVVCMKVSAYHQELFNYLSEQNDYQFTMMTDAGKPSQKCYTDITILKEKVPYFSTAILLKNSNEKPCQK
ncbi:precorrin-2 C(20)-methyltransferase [Sunxiuqinia indica]|uniref:precorrin-2 C(20)-methyltransferase n=1 Tax=Sunxiuqinia indica TaxID=2692584 RepID=UPI00135BEF9D|nr:precorrin-2 C(20)-methyltransferase [Sunxiuqinia indica]